MHEVHLVLIYRFTSVDSNFRQEDEGLGMSYYYYHFFGIILIV